MSHETGYLVGLLLEHDLEVVAVPYEQYLDALRETGNVEDAIYIAARRLGLSEDELHERLDEAASERGAERVYAETRAALAASLADEKEA